MKKLLSIIILCLGCFGFLEAQDNIWKPINTQGLFLGAGPDGSLFAHHGYSGLARSQDEGATWQIVAGYQTGFDYYFNIYCFCASPEGRVFVFNDDLNAVVYSDDNGDTWQQTDGIPTTQVQWVQGLYAVNNDTIIGWTQRWNDANRVFWTMDGGQTWDYTELSFMDEYLDISDLIVNEAGDVYAGIWYYSGYHSGIYHSTLSDMQNWELAAFDGAAIFDLAFDPEGNVVASYFWTGPGYSQEPGFYLFGSTSFGISNNGIIYNWNPTANNTATLTYSFDHGEHFTEIGEGLPLSEPAPGGQDGTLTKGFDNHLYFYGNGQYWKSIRKADYILENFPLENTAWVQFYRSMYEDSTYYQLGIKGDTVVNETAYKKVINCAHLGYPIEGECFGGIREDGDGKCYFMSFVDAIYAPWPLHYDCEANTEYPLYDFSLSVCDVFQTIGLTPHVVFDTAEMQLNGSTKKVLWFGNNCDNGNPYEWQWIEGIGSTHSLLYPIQDEPDNGPEYRLVEVWQDEQLLYRNPHFEEDFPYDNTRWSIYYQNLYLDWAPYIQIGMIGDTIVDGATYHKMIKCTSYGNLIDGDCFGGIRVEADGKWYFRLFTDENVPQYLYLDMEPNTERLLYDFSLSECDRFYFEGDLYNDPEYWMSVFDIDEIEINGSMRRRLWFDSNCEEGNHPYDWNWIEGIGSNFGLLYSIQAFPLDGSNYHLGEVYQDGELIYRDPYFIDEPSSPEWYYEIQNENGSITYQYLYQAGDTIIQDEPTHILVRINTLYDKDVHTDVTHEYVYERDGKLYWWNKTMEVFTLLYDFEAEVGDYWEIKVGTESLMMHVDAVEEIEYEGRIWRMLRVSDPDDLFSGNIVCGIGHLTSFFPERLMNNGDGIRVEGLRCYWVENELVFKIGDEDCDAVYSEVHGVEDPSTGSGALVVYPNPTNGVLFVRTHAVRPYEEYRITNIVGQTLLQGSITDETQQIDVSGLSEGMYFMTIGSETRKFVVR